VTPKEIIGWVLFGVMVTLMVIDIAHVLYVKLTSKEAEDG